MIQKRLYVLRKSKKWSMQYVADQLGIAKSTYAGYESGYRQPSLDAVKELANLFETSADYLLGNSNQLILSQPITSIELTKIDTVSHVQLKIDEKPLSRDELIQCIAFVQLKRKIESEM